MMHNAPGSCPHFVVRRRDGEITINEFAEGFSP